MTITRKYTQVKISRQIKHKKKRNKQRKSKKYREYVSRQRAKAARRKTRVEKHRRKHPKKETRRGFFVLFARYVIDRVKIREYLEKNIYFQKKPNSKFSITDMLVGLIGLIALGIPRIYKVAKYKEEKLLAHTLKMDCFFSDTTAYRFLKAFGFHTFCCQLQKANSKMLRALWDADELIIVDGDSSTLRSYENKKDGAIAGYNKLRPGRPCYQAIAYFVNGFCAKSEVVPGNEVPIKSLKLFTDLRDVRRLCGRVDWIRLDAGYVSELNLKRMDSFSVKGNSRQKVRFIINVGQKGIGATQAIALSKSREWQYLKKGVYVQDFPEIQVFSSYNKFHRIVLIKKYCKQTKQGKTSNTWKYYALVTNETSMSADELYRFYVLRQCIEDFFDEAKNSYFIEKLPSSKLWSNSLYFNVITFTFNLLYLFRHEVLRRKDHYLYLNTLQWEYFDLEILWDGSILTIDRSLPQYRVLIMILQRLKKLNIPLEYRLCG